MTDAPSVPLARPALATRIADRCFAGWCRVREYAYGLKLVWIPLLSVVFGGVLFLTPQAQDLFLEVRGTPADGLRFWLQFYLMVLVIWVLPIYISSRWLLWQFREDGGVHPDRRAVTDHARRIIPAILATACPLTLLIGQFLALLNVPDLVDLTLIEDNIAGHRATIATHCGTLSLPCILAYGRFLGDGALWVLRSEWGLGTEHMVLLLYVFASCNLLWHVLGYRLRYVDDPTMRRWFRVLWWVVTLVTLPLTITLVLVFSGYLVVEARNPHTVAHLAVLPALSLGAAHALWLLLKPSSATQAPMLAKLLMGRPRSHVGEADAMRVLVNPLYFFLIGFAALATIALLAVNPLDVTALIARVQLVPFLLGPLVPSMTYLSHWSARTQAPLVVLFIVFIGVANSLVPDRHAVRTVEIPAAVQRQSLDLSVLQWTATNGCDISRPESCPSPIIIAAAGGASRAGFFTAGLIGKLIDERTTLAALGPALGQPMRSLRPFENQLFAISAVSGGSLGAVMSFAALADRRTPPEWPSSPGAKLAPPCRPDQSTAHTEWYGASPSERQPAPAHESWQSCLGLLVAGDFLSPVFVKLMGTDLVGLGMRSDRAVTLEQAWELRYADITGRNTVARGLSEVRAEAASRSQWLPILLLNGTSVEAGRRIITSDIDVTERGLGMSRADQPTRADRPFVDVRDLHELLDGADAPARSRQSKPAASRDLALSTGATMSARFPLISPHGSIRTADGTILDRVVDGGYYENFGASTALELVRLLKTRYRLTPTVILINNEPTTDAMDCVTDDTQVSPPGKPSQRFWFSTFMSPFDAINRTRIARGSHAAVELCTYVRSREVGGAFAFVTVRKSGDKPLSMSWWLSKHVQEYLALHLAPEDAGGPDASNRNQQFRRVNQKAFQQIVRQRLLPGG